MRCSIVIPTKERHRILAACLESVREAKGPEDEVIVVDSSTDGWTKAYCEQSGVVDRYLWRNMSQVDATNLGVVEAKGRYVKVFSDDDFLNGPGHLRSLEIADQHPEVDMFVCGGVKFRTDNSAFTCLCWDESVNFGRSVERIYATGAFGGGQLIRRHVFDKVGMFAPLRVMDMEFACRCVAEGLTVRFMRVNTFLHPIYAHSGLVKAGEQTNAETAAVFAKYGVTDSQRPKCMYPPTWDGAVI